MSILGNRKTYVQDCTSIKYTSNERRSTDFHLTTFCVHDIPYCSCTYLQATLNGSEKKHKFTRILNGTTENTPIFYASQWNSWFGLPIEYSYTYEIDLHFPNHSNRNDLFFFFFLRAFQTTQTGFQLLYERIKAIEDQIGQLDMDWKFFDRTETIDEGKRRN